MRYWVFDFDKISKSILPVAVLALPLCQRNGTYDSAYIVHSRHPPNFTRISESVTSYGLWLSLSVSQVVYTPTSSIIVQTLFHANLAIVRNIR